MYNTATCRHIITFIYLCMAVEVCKVIRIFSLDKFEMLCQDGSVNFNLRILQSVL